MIGAQARSISLRAFCVCRRCGEMLVDAPGAPVSMQAVESAVDRVAAAGSWDEVRRHLHADQATLLSPVTEKYLAFARARYPAGGVGLRPLAMADRIVARGPEVGIDQAIVDLGAARPPPSPRNRLDRRQPAARATSAAVSNSAVRLDQRLIGHWRSTETLMSGGFSMVTNSHCALDRDGEFAFWSMTGVAPNANCRTRTRDMESPRWRVAPQFPRRRCLDESVSRRRQQHDLAKGWPLPGPCRG